MIVSGVVSIPSAVGSSTVFTVVGTRTLMYAQAFQAYLIDALQAGTLTIVGGDTVSATGAVSFAAPVAGKVNEAVLAQPSGTVNAGGLTATVPGGYQFLFDSYGGSATITGAATGGDVLVEGINAAATYLDEGGNNVVVFVDGNNHYVGDSTAGAGNDIIVTGSGFDTVDTGYGKSTVDSGTGRAVINLNDTGAAAAGSYNDYVYLDDGHNTINANGTRDAVVATASGQTINGGVSATQYDGVVLVSGSAAGNDVVNANGATVALFDNSTGNSVFGGTGQLIFIGGVDVAASILGGTGTTDIFGAAGDSIVFSSLDGSGTVAFVAGSGNETLYGGLAPNNLALFASNSDAASVTGVQDVLTGGAGNDTLVSGTGNETLTGGAGNNVFLIDASATGVGANIVITDFGANTGNLLGFANYTQSEIDNALAGAHTVTGAYGETDTVITLSDNTQVTFLGVSSLTGHTFGS